MKAKILTIVFVSLLCVSTALVTVFPRDDESVKRENREVSEFPKFSAQTLADGSFMTGMDSYLNDRVAYRGMFTDFSARAKLMTGINSDLGKVISVKKDIGTGTVSESYLVYHDKTVMESYIYNAIALNSYVNSVNSYAKVFSRDINMYSMIVPTRLEFEDALYSSLQSSQKESIDMVYQDLDDRYKTVDVYSALADKRDEYIYFRTDHHWTADGAYEAYVAYCKTAGLTPVKKLDYKKLEYPGLLGSLYDQSQEIELKKAPDTLVRYNTDPSGEISLTMYAKENGREISYRGVLFNETLSPVKYAAFMGGDHPLAEIKNSNAETEKTLLVFKDSYANAFLPWVVKNYETVIVIDPRSYKGDISEITASYKIDDFLMMNYIFSTSFEDYCVLLSNLAK